MASLGTILLSFSGKMIESIESIQISKDVVVHPN